MPVLAVVSDTHGKLYPEVVAALAGSDLIVHAGDLGGSEVLDTLEGIAPLVAVRGNTDTGAWSLRLPPRAEFEWAGVKCLVVHNLAGLGRERRLIAQGLGEVRVVIHGHSHRAEAVWSGGVLFFNPGSAGPRRFLLPRTIGRLRVVDGRVVTEIVEMGR